MWEAVQSLFFIPEMSALILLHKPWPRHSRKIETTKLFVVSVTILGMASCVVVHFRLEFRNLFCELQMKKITDLVSFVHHQASMAMGSSEFAWNKKCKIHTITGNNDPNKGNFERIHDVVLLGKAVQAQRDVRWPNACVAPLQHAKPRPQERQHRKTSAPR